jgi:hypothetical protein
MTKTLQLLLALMGGVLFALGLLLGQIARPSKFDKYLRPAPVELMDLALLRVNVEIIRDNMDFGVPTVTYDSSCACFAARAAVPSETINKPLAQVRATLIAKAFVVRHNLEDEFPELSKRGTEMLNTNTLPVPDHDFKMTFFEIDPQKPKPTHDIAEYEDGKIIFK